jgi:hypothetical protein
MSMGLTHLPIKPVDLFNICRTLRLKKAKESPRSLRYELSAGQPARVVLEPWEHEIKLSAPSTYTGAKPLSIRTWGRDRLQILERLLPICKHVDIYLAGYGLPSFYVLDLGPATCTLASSGWTDTDWTGGASFELLTRRMSLSAEELLSVYDSLREDKFGTDHDLAAKTGLGVEKSRSAMSYLCQAGRAMVDLGGSVFRHRDLFFEPFDLKAANKVLRSSADDNNPAAKAARLIFEKGDARFRARRPVSTGYKLSGSVRGIQRSRVRPLLHVDHEGRIIEASCTCSTYKKLKMTKGPCEHILALRLIHMDRLEGEEKH